MRDLPEEIEQYRDRKWHREESLKVETAEQVEAMVEDLGFCLGMTDIRKELPSVYIAVCDAATLTCRPPCKKTMKRAGRGC